MLLDNKTEDSANLQHFQNNLNTNPKDVDALYGLAVTQERLGMLRESLETFRRALVLAPEDADILRDLGIAYYKNGQFHDASAYLGRSLGIEKDNAIALLYMGRTEEARGDVSKALSFYKELEKKQLDDPEVLYSLAMAYGKANQQGNSHYYFGLYFKKKEKADSALFHFKAAIKHFAPDAVRSKEITKEIESLKR